MKTFASAVGHFVAHFRKEHSLTLDMVASAGRAYGATWNTASIRNIEAGKFSPTIQSLLILALALGHLSGTALRLDDLFGDAEAFDAPTLGPDGRASRGWVKGALSGLPVDGERPVSVPEDPYPWSPARENVAMLKQSHDNLVELEAPAELVEEARELLFRARVDASQEPPELEGGYPEPGPPTLAEERAARRLGVSPRELQNVSLKLWGQGLDAESLERAGKGSSPQARGIETRRLLEEIQEELAISG
ncbi:MAG: helix-turn-helix domain-containing protein [Agrococcus casei]|uniref:helix-turn-helix domain-containing protein n=1 Tax=Agrococcus casei TaxID=343512 RepID=UPI003F92CB89